MKTIFICDKCLNECVEIKLPGDEYFYTCRDCVKHFREVTKMVTPEEKSSPALR
jgi:hypothetical protein